MFQVIEKEKEFINLPSPNRCFTNKIIFFLSYFLSYLWSGTRVISHAFASKIKVLEGLSNISLVNSKPIAAQRVLIFLS